MRLPLVTGIKDEIDEENVLVIEPEPPASPKLHEEEDAENVSCLMNLS